jgi:hypothetical protein
MNAKIHHAAAAGELRIIEPRLVWPIGVVEYEIHRVDVSQFA